MTVQELIELLADCDEGAEIRLACQPSWPMQFTVAGVCTSDALESDSEAAADDAEVVWIVQGVHPNSGSPYCPSAVWGEMEEAR